MFEINYKIEVIDILLNEDCILTRYYPLIHYKCTLIINLKKAGCFTKAACQEISDDDLLKKGLPDSELVSLFRKFLAMYDIENAKLKEIASVSTSPEERDSFIELYHLPGVKSTRAKLYYIAGFKTLIDIATSTQEQIISRTSAVIEKGCLELKAPLPKEVRTHIAVAKAFTCE